MDKNEVYLQGTIGSDLLYKKSIRGSEYATFSLVIEPMRRLSESRTYIRIMVFDKSLVKYLRENKARCGKRIDLQGYITSHKQEVGGKDLMLNTIVAKQITL